MESPAKARPDAGIRFLAVCPFCKLMKFRAPLSRYAQFVECRHCHKMFILIPDDPSSIPADLLAAAAAKANGAPPPDLKYVPPPAPAPIPTATEQPREVAATVVATEVTPGPNVPLGFALSSVILFGAGILVTQIPYGRFAGLAFGIVGLMLAGLSLLGLEKRQWLGYAGLGLNAIGLLLIVALPDWLGGPTWLPPNYDSLDSGTPMAVGRNGGSRQVADWVDASSAVWEHRDVQIEVISAIVGLSDSDPKDRNRKRDLVLKISVKLTNIGVARAIDFGVWNAVPPQTTTGPLAATTVAPTVVSVIVLPGKSFEVTLIYPAPSGPLGNIRLELPAEAFGDTGPIRFEIPGSMLRRIAPGRPATGTP